MALTNKASAPTAVQNPVPPTTGSKIKDKKTEANQEILQRGAQIMAGMSDESRANLCSKSSQLHFVRLLGLASKKTNRRVSATQTKDCATAVGLVLRTLEDIQVPVIDILKNKNTGIDPETDITYREVKAGEEFTVSYYEFMYLIIRPEYSGYCHYDGNDQGVYFSAKLPAYFKGKAKLPTPTVNFKSGSVKEVMVDIDEKGPNGWEIKEAYAEKFGPLIKKATPKRASGNKTTVSSTVATSVALYQILLAKKDPVEGTVKEPVKDQA